MKPRKIVTPVHFLSINPKVGLPATVSNHDNAKDTQTKVERSKRRAAVQAGDKIYAQF